MSTWPLRQGSVLGPLLFLVYINDLPDCVSPGRDTRLYADDSAISREIKGQADREILQQDLDKLQEWEDQWLMEFNPDKCQAMRISNKRNPSKPSYNIHGQELEVVDTAKYLGVSINNKLKWNKHIADTAKKADYTRAFLKRNINMCPREVKKQCYVALVRPVMEYASEIWDPQTQNNITALERVQRRSTRFIMNDYSRESSVTLMMKDLQLQPLRERRAHTKATTFYKAINGLLEVPTYHLLPQHTITRGHSRRYQIPNSRLATTKASFYPDSINLWNHLPGNVAEAPTLEKFRAGLQPLTLRV